MAKINAELVQKILGEFVYADVVSPVVVLDEVKHMGPGYGILVEGSLCPVLGHTSGEVRLAVACLPVIRSVLPARSEAVCINSFCAAHKVTVGYKQLSSAFSELTKRCA